MKAQVHAGTGRMVVAGIGNEYRRDDGLGAVVAALVAAREPRVHDVGPVVEPLDLLTRWDGAEVAVVIDAVRSREQAGTVSVLDLCADSGNGHVMSSHGIDLSGALRIARTVGQAPSRVVAVGVVGADFSHGMGLSPEVHAALPVAEQAVLEVLSEARGCA
jgi:hydrogenase maturation protease